MARVLNICLSLNQHPYFVYTSSEGSGKSGLSEPSLLGISLVPKSHVLGLAHPIKILCIP